MTLKRPRMGRLDVTFIILAIIFLLFLSNDLARISGKGPVDLFVLVFNNLILFMAIQGFFVMLSIRGTGHVGLRKIAKWLAIFTSGFTIIILLMFNLLGANLIIEIGMDPHSPAGVVVSFFFLLVVFMGVALYYIAAASCGLWVLAKFLRWFLPVYLSEVRKVRFEGHDGPVRWFYAWIVSVPFVLDPSSLRFETQAMSAKGARGRYFEAMKWQMAFGMLVAVYFTLNPLVLSSLKFDEIFRLVSIPIGLIPLAIIPWAVLEGLGAHIPGIRKDFYLHQGAKKRMLQTLLALGTLFIIVRMGVESQGPWVLLATFGALAVILFVLSALISFVYFNHFEASLINDINQRLKNRGF